MRMPRESKKDRASSESRKRKKAIWQKKKAKQAKREERRARRKARKKTPADMGSWTPEVDGGFEIHFDPSTSERAVREPGMHPLPRVFMQLGTDITQNDEDGDRPFEYVLKT